MSVEAHLLRAAKTVRKIWIACNRCKKVYLGVPRVSYGELEVWLLKPRKWNTVLHALEEARHRPRVPRVARNPQIEVPRLAVDPHCAHGLSADH